MQMIEVKTSELVGAALDWAVAKAEGVTVRVLSADNPGELWQVQKQWRGVGPYWPSQDWSQAGLLIEKYNIQTSYNGNAFPKSPTGKYWCAYVCKPHGPEERPSGGGHTPIIAACRAIVAAKLGDTVSVPAELVESAT